MQLGSSRLLFPGCQSIGDLSSSSGLGPFSMGDSIFVGSDFLGPAPCTSHRVTTVCSPSPLLTGTVSVLFDFHGAGRCGEHLVQGPWQFCVIPLDRCLKRRMAGWMREHLEGL